MKEFFKSMTSRLGVAGELMEFLWARKLWWLMPMIFILIVFGVFFVFAAASGLGPFVYTLW
ncbi:MAG: hypothetical protein DWQ07_09615 [Chloroflexi bacterium]|nr:MAG: hypothetical protein DWQ07_09615 [Chloroflexota bacterium]MBL1193029.1 hypothetical protein [Chloroflexota bacterium]NOH10322.1 hypothetical protein [Chloroflexota bacterium]